MEKLIYLILQVALNLNLKKNCLVRIIASIYRFFLCCTNSYTLSVIPFAFTFTFTFIFKSFFIVFIFFIFFTSISDFI